MIFMCSLERESKLADLEPATKSDGSNSMVGQSCQQFWTQQMEHLAIRHKRRESGLRLARAITDIVDVIVLHAYHEATDSGELNPRVTLVALGGYGRQEMAPFSDVDLLFLYDRVKDKSGEFNSAVLRPLWDAGFDVGHSTRTVSESVRMMKGDLESCTAMLDARFLAGDSELFEKFQNKVFRSVPKKTVGNLAKLRHSRYGKSGRVQVLDPNVKESAGGLREIHLLEWALKAHTGTANIEPVWEQFFDHDDAKTLVAGRDYLWRVRNELHFAMKRKQDVLDNEHKTTIAVGLGYEDRAVTEVAHRPFFVKARSDAVIDSQHRVGSADRYGQDRGFELAAEHFMRDYYTHARQIFHLVELGFGRVTRDPRRRGRPLLVDEGVIAQDGEISISDDESYFREQPLRILRIFSHAQLKNMRLSEQVQRYILQSLYLIDDEFRREPEARVVFFTIIRRKQRVATTLRLMHNLGVLGAYLPEFGSLTCLVQYDVFHLYTVDEHTLVALENFEAISRNDDKSVLKRVYDDLDRRDLLVLGILLHDVGKSRREEHIRCGVEMTTELLRRFDLSEADQRFVLFLVKCHQEMVVISQRRDLDDNRMIAEFAGRFATVDWLRALYLLSYADLSAVATDAWSDWHGALLWELYHKTKEQLESGLKTLVDSHHARQKLDQHLKAIGGTWPASRIKAFQAHVELLPGRYLSTYNRDEIERHLEATCDFISKEPEMNITIDFVTHPHHTEVLVCARDHSHLLANICGVLSVHDIDILRAGVNTRDDGVVLDVFQVTDVDGAAALPDWKQARVRLQLTEVMMGESNLDDLFKRYSANWKRRRKNLPLRTPKVEFENQISEDFTVVDTDVQNGVGVLYAITSELAEMNLDVHTAIINTVAERARDAFYVVDNANQKIVNYQFLDTIRGRLLEALGESPTRH